MEPLEKKEIEKAVLVGLNAGIFSKEENASEQTLDELEALLEGISDKRNDENES